MEWRHEHATLILINKFGREEAHGRGLRPVIAEALIAEIPLVIGVSTRKSLRLSDFRRGFSHTSEARHRGNYGLVPERD